MSLVKSFCLLLVSFFALNTTKAQIFFEDFQGQALPAGWAVFDGDGQTAHPNVAQFTSAWIVAEDFDIATDYVAMSTSWYQPLTGPSNDWLLTPGITMGANYELRWQGEAQDASFPDGYVVRANVASQMPANTTNYPTLLLTVAAESGATRTNRTVNLQTAGLSSGTAHFAWVNNSLDMFVLMINDVEVRSTVSNDVSMETATENEYTIIPLAQATSIPLNGSIKNVGVNPAPTTMTVNVYDGSFTNVYTATSPSQNLASGATGNFTVAGFVPTAADFYVFEYIANLTGDGDHSNDTLYWAMTVSDSTMARDNGQVVGFLGIGAGNGGVLGQVYKLNVGSTMSSLSFYFRPNIGQTYVADVYSYNTTTHTPNAVIASTVPFVSTVDTAIFITQMLTTPLNIAANDTFFVGVREPDSTLGLGYCADNFRQNVTFINWPTIAVPWSNNEDFNFNVVYVLRPNFDACASLAATVSGTPTTCGNATGSATATPTGGVGPYTYLWSNSGTTATVNNLAAGTYTVTVTDANSCTQVSTVIINNSNGPSTSNTSVTNVSCNGAANGSITITPSGGTSPYTYMWSNSATTATVTGLAGGVYTVTVSDATLCTAIASVTITEPSALATNATASNESCQSCSDGSATATPTGGTSPYTYAWSNGGTTQTINFLAPGTYTVTVTDANGCTQNQTVTVAPFIVGINDVVDIDVQIFPNPTNGQFALNVLTVAAEEIRVDIYGALGQLVWSDSKSASNTYNREFSSNELAAGRYMVKITSGDKTLTRKLVIQ